MHTGTILTPDELNELIGNIASLFVHDVSTGSLVLTITYQSLMAIKPQLLKLMKTEPSPHIKFDDGVYDQISMKELASESLS